MSWGYGYTPHSPFANHRTPGSGDALGASFRSKTCAKSVNITLIQLYEAYLRLGAMTSKGGVRCIAVPFSAELR
jgi:hypothetical protein